MTSLADFICSNMQKIKSTMYILSFIISNSLYSQSSDSIIQWPQNYNPTEASFFEKIFQPKKLSKLHDKWLQGLKENAEQPKVIN